MYEIIHTENFQMVAAFVLSAIVMGYLLLSDLSIAAAAGSSKSSSQLHRVLAWLLFMSAIVFIVWQAGR